MRSLPNNPENPTVRSHPNSVAAETDTERKLQDAGTQLRLALEYIRDEVVFRSCINAFIAHARSVTFVMQTESAVVPGLTEWYEVEMSELKKRPLLQFFQHKRTHTIHKGVVAPKSRSVNIEKLTVGRLEFDRPGYVTAWEFEGFREYVPDDSGNVIRVSEQYFIVLKDFVTRWLEQKNA